MSDFNRALTAMVAGLGGIAQIRQVADELSDALLTHLAYEEEELLEPLRHSALVA